MSDELVIIFRRQINFSTSVKKHPDLRIDPGVQPPLPNKHKASKSASASAKNYQFTYLIELGLSNFFQSFQKVVNTIADALNSYLCLK